MISILKVLMGWVEEFMFCVKKRNLEFVMKNVVVIVRLCMFLVFEKILVIYLLFFFLLDFMLL